MSDPRTDQDAVLIDIAVRYGQGELSDAEFVTAIREQFTGWQDIATAPKDGSHILVCRWPLHQLDGDLSLFVHNVSWWSEERRGEGAWIVYNDQVQEAECFFQPTHWTPLPPAPRETPK